MASPPEKDPAHLISINARATQGCATAHLCRPGIRASENGRKSHPQAFHPIDAVFILAHVGIGLGAAWLLTYRRPSSIDFRIVLLGTLLPELIDKPLGLLLELQGRLWAHSLLFLGGTILVSRIRAFRMLQWIGFGVATHLVLDEMWEWPNAALWPFGGPFHRGTWSLSTFIHTLFTDPIVVSTEVVGAVVLVALAWAYGIRSWAALRAFLRHGQLVRPPVAT